MAAMVGHDLVIEVTRWTGQIENGEKPKVQVRLDSRSLEVRTGTGGAKPLTEKDRADIKANLEKVLKVDRHPEIVFTSTEVTLAGGMASVSGDLTLAGTTRAVRFPALLSDAGGVLQARGTVPLAQTDWGVKPYSAFMGTLKVKDEIEVTFDLALNPLSPS
jgi:polyisoprenoid-binding protein YceI